MSRDQKIKIAMVICAVIVLCAVIITSTGMFNGTGIGGYANADKYTAGPAEVTGRVKKLEVNWTSGKVIVAYHAENMVLLEESAKRELSENEKMRWWLDGETLRVQFAASGTHWNMPEKKLTITLPEGTAFENASIQTTSADVLEAAGRLPASGEAERLRELYIRARYHHSEKMSNAEVEEAKTLLANIREQVEAGKVDGLAAVRRKDPA